MVRAKKHWGQHWLASRRLADDLVAAAGIGPDDVVIEIGPGTGLLTGALLATGARVTAIEVDARCAERLRLEHPDAPLEVIQGDVLTVDPERLPFGETPVRLVGNLPYNVTGPILRWTTEHRHDLADAHFMLQREVAARLAAPHGSRTYGALSVQIQWHFAVQVLKRLSPGAFRPPPKVHSAFIRLTPRLDAQVSEFADRLVQAGFGQRRKQLVRSLGSAGQRADDVAEALVKIGARPDARAEMLSPECWLALVDRLAGPS